MQADAIQNHNRNAANIATAFVFAQLFAYIAHLHDQIREIMWQPRS